ncbi:MAG: tetratricopeptide repeat protein [Phototrophicaceae bacterium]
MTSDNTQRPLPDIDDDFRDRVNEIYQAWHQNHIPFADASQQLETMRQEAIANGKVLNEAGIYNILGMIHGYRSKYDNSIINFDKARMIYEENGAIRRVATVDLNLGETYRLLGNFIRAKTYFRRAYEEATTLGNMGLQSISLTNEGQMWISLKSFDKAHETLEEALNITTNIWQPEDDADKIRRADNACEIYHALAGLALEENDPQTAWQYAVKSYENAEFSGRIVRMGYANRVLGDVITVLGQSPDPAFNSDVDYYYAEAMSAFKQVNAEGEVAKTLLAQGQSLNKRGKKRSAGNKYQQAMVIFTRLGMMDAAAEAAQAQTETI